MNLIVLLGSRYLSFVKCVCVCETVCHVCMGTFQGLNVSDSPEMELQAVASLLTYSGS